MAESIDVTIRAKVEGLQDAEKAMGQVVSQAEKLSPAMEKAGQTITALGKDFTELSNQSGYLPEQMNTVLSGMMATITSSAKELLSTMRAAGDGMSESIQSGIHAASAYLSENIRQMSSVVTLMQQSTKGIATSMHSEFERSFSDMAHSMVQTMQGVFSSGTVHAMSDAAIEKTLRTNRQFNQQFTQFAKSFGLDNAQSSALLQSTIKSYIPHMNRSDYIQNVAAASHGAVRTDIQRDRPLTYMQRLPQRYQNLPEAPSLMSDKQLSEYRASQSGQLSVAEYNRIKQLVSHNQTFERALNMTGVQTRQTGVDVDLNGNRRAYTIAMPKSALTRSQVGEALGHMLRDIVNPELEGAPAYYLPIGTGSEYQRQNRSAKNSKVPSEGIEAARVLAEMGIDPAFAAIAHTHTVTPKTTKYIGIGNDIHIRPNRYQIASLTNADWLAGRLPGAESPFEDKDERFDKDRTNFGEAATSKRKMISQSAVTDALGMYGHLTYGNGSKIDSSHPKMLQLDLTDRYYKLDKDGNVEYVNGKPVYNEETKKLISGIFGNKTGRINYRYGGQDRTYDYAIRQFAGENYVPIMQKNGLITFAREQEYLGEPGSGVGARASLERFGVNMFDAFFRRDAAYSSGEDVAKALDVPNRGATPSVPIGALGGRLPSASKIGIVDLQSVLGLDGVSLIEQGYLPGSDATVRAFGLKGSVASAPLKEIARTMLGLKEGDAFYAPKITANKDVVELFKSQGLGAVEAKYGRDTIRDQFEDLMQLDMWLDKSLLKSPVFTKDIGALRPGQAVEEAPLRSYEDVKKTTMDVLKMSGDLRLVSTAYDFLAHQDELSSQAAQYVDFGTKAAADNQRRWQMHLYRLANDDQYAIEHLFSNETDQLAMDIRANKSLLHTDNEARQRRQNAVDAARVSMLQGRVYDPNNLAMAMALPNVFGAIAQLGKMNGITPVEGMEGIINLPMNGDEASVGTLLALFSHGSQSLAGLRYPNNLAEQFPLKNSRQYVDLLRKYGMSEHGIYMNMDTIARMGGGDFDGDTVQLMRGKLAAAVKRTFAQRKMDLDLKWDPEKMQYEGTPPKPEAEAHSGAIGPEDFAEQLFRQAVQPLLLGGVSRASGAITQFDWSDPQIVKMYGKAGLQLKNAYDVDTTFLKTGKVAEWTPAMWRARNAGTPFSHIWKNIIGAVQNHSFDQMEKFSNTNFASAYSVQTMSMLKAMQDNPMSSSFMQELISAQNALEGVDTLRQGDAIDRAKAAYLEKNTALMAMQAATGRIIGNKSLGDLEGLLGALEGETTLEQRRLGNALKQNPHDAELQRRKDELASQRKFINQQRARIEAAKTWGATESRMINGDGVFNDKIMGGKGWRSTEDTSAFTEGTDDWLSLMTAITVGNNEVFINSTKAKAMRANAERMSDIRKRELMIRADMGGTYGAKKNQKLEDNTGYSVSQLQLLERSNGGPRSWFTSHFADEPYRSPQSREALIGTAVHAALEQRGRDNAAPQSADDYVKIFNDTLEANKTLFPTLPGAEGSGTSFDDALIARYGRALGFVRSLPTLMQDFGVSEILGVEEQLHPNFGKKALNPEENVKSTGKLDMRVRLNDGSMAIIDLKPMFNGHEIEAGKTLSQTRMDEETQQHWEQPSIYAKTVNDAAGGDASRRISKVGIMTYNENTPRLIIADYDEAFASAALERMQGSVKTIQALAASGVELDRPEAENVLNALRLQLDPNSNQYRAAWQIPNGPAIDLQQMLADLHNMLQPGSEERAQISGMKAEQARQAAFASEKSEIELGQKTVRGMALAGQLQQDISDYEKQLMSMSSKFDRLGKDSKESNMWENMRRGLTEQHASRLADLQQRGMTDSERAKLDAEAVEAMDKYEAALGRSAIYDLSQLADEFEQKIQNRTKSQATLRNEEETKKIDEQIRRASQAREELMKEEGREAEKESATNELNRLMAARDRIVAMNNANADLASKQEELSYQKSIMDMNARLGYGSENTKQMRDQMQALALDELQLKIYNKHGISSLEDYRSLSSEDKDKFWGSLSQDEKNAFRMDADDIKAVNKIRDEYEEERQKTLRQDRMDQTLDNIRRNRPGQPRPYGIIGRAYLQQQSQYEAHERQYNNFVKQRDAAQSKVDMYDKIMAQHRFLNPDYKLNEEDQRDYDNAKNQVADMQRAAAAEKESMDSISGASGALITGMNVIGDTFSRLSSMFGRRIFMKLINEISQFVKQYDAAMTNIQMITLKTDEEMDRISESNISTAIGLQADVTTVANTKASLYRQGLTDEEVEDRTEQIIKFAKVAGVKTETASKIITTALQNGLVDSAQEAIDVLSALGDSAATTADEIQKALQKTAATAANAGTSYEELTATLTIALAKTQLSGNVVGTALSTIMTRMRRVNESDYVKNSTGEITTINDVDRALSRVGVSLRDEKGNMKDTITVLKELAKVWNDIDSDVQKQNIVYAMAGRGSAATNTFYSIMEGLSEDGGAEFNKALETALGSEGIVDQKYEMYIDTLNGKLTELKSAFQGLIETVKAGGVTGFFADLASSSLEALTALGGLPTVITAISAGIAAVIVNVKMLAAAKTAATALGSTLLNTLATPLALLTALTVVGVGAGIGAMLRQNAERQAQQQETERLASEWNEKHSTDSQQKLIYDAKESYATMQTIYDKYSKLRSDFTSADKDFKNSADYSDFETALNNLGKVFGEDFVSQVRAACEEVDGFKKALDMVKSGIDEFTNKTDIQTALNKAHIGEIVLSRTRSYKQYVENEKNSPMTAAEYFTDQAYKNIIEEVFDGATLNRKMIVHNGVNKLSASLGDGLFFDIKNYSDNKAHPLDYELGKLTVKKLAEASGMDVDAAIGIYDDMVKSKIGYVAGEGDAAIGVTDEDMVQLNMFNEFVDELFDDYLKPYIVEDLGEEGIEEAKAAFKKNQTFKKWKFDYAAMDKEWDQILPWITNYVNEYASTEEHVPAGYQFKDNDGNVLFTIPSDMSSLSAMNEVNARYAAAIADAEATNTLFEDFYSNRDKKQEAIEAKTKYEQEYADIRDRYDHEQLLHEADLSTARGKLAIAESNKAMTESQIAINASQLQTNEANKPNYNAYEKAAEEATKAERESTEASYTLSEEYQKYIEAETRYNEVVARAGDLSLDISSEAAQKSVENLGRVIESQEGVVDYWNNEVDNYKNKINDTVKQKIYNNLEKVEFPSLEDVYDFLAAETYATGKMSTLEAQGYYIDSIKKSEGDTLKSWNIAGDIMRFYEYQLKPEAKLENKLTAESINNAYMLTQAAMEQDIIRSAQADLSARLNTGDLSLLSDEERRLYGLGAEIQDLNTKIAIGTEQISEGGLDHNQRIATIQQEIASLEKDKTYNEKMYDTADYLYNRYLRNEAVAQARTNAKDAAVMQIQNLDLQYEEDLAAENEDYQKQYNALRDQVQDNYKAAYMQNDALADSLKKTKSKNPETQMEGLREIGLMVSNEAPASLFAPGVDYQAEMAKMEERKKALLKVIALGIPSQYGGNLPTGYNDVLNEVMSYIPQEVLDYYNALGKLNKAHGGKLENITSDYQQQVDYYNTEAYVETFAGENYIQSLMKMIASIAQYDTENQSENMLKSGEQFAKMQQHAAEIERLNNEIAAKSAELSELESLRFPWELEAGSEGSAEYYGDQLNDLIALRDAKQKEYDALNEEVLQPIIDGLRSSEEWTDKFEAAKLKMESQLQNIGTTEQRALQILNGDFVGWLENWIQDNPDSRYLGEFKSMLVSAKTYKSDHPSEESPFKNFYSELYAMWTGDDLNPEWKALKTELLAAAETERDKQIQQIEESYWNDVETIFAGLDEAQYFSLTESAMLGAWWDQDIQDDFVKRKIFAQAQEAYDSGVWDTYHYDADNGLNSLLKRSMMDYVLSDEQDKADIMNDIWGDEVYRDMLYGKFEETFPVNAAHIPYAFMEENMALRNPDTIALNGAVAWKNSEENRLQELQTALSTAEQQVALSAEREQALSALKEARTALSAKRDELKQQADSILVKAKEDAGEQYDADMQAWEAVNKEYLRIDGELKETLANIVAYEITAAQAGVDKLSKWRNPYAINELKAREKLGSATGKATTAVKNYENSVKQIKDQFVKYELEWKEEYDNDMELAINTLQQHIDVINDFWSGMKDENGNWVVDVLKNFVDENGEIAYKTVFDYMAEYDRDSEKGGYQKQKATIYRLAKESTSAQMFKRAVDNIMQETDEEGNLTKEAANMQTYWESISENTDFQKAIEQNKIPDFMLTQLFGQNYSPIEDINKILKSASSYQEYQAAIERIQRGKGFFSEADVTLIRGLKQWESEFNPESQDQVQEAIDLIDATFGESGIANNIIEKIEALSLATGRYEDWINKQEEGANTSFAEYLNQDVSAFDPTELAYIRAASRLGISLDSVYANGRAINWSMPNGITSSESNVSLVNYDMRTKEQINGVAEKVWAAVNNGVGIAGIEQLLVKEDSATIEQLKNTWSDLITYLNLDDKDSTMAKNLRRTIEIQFAVNGLDDLEAAGVVLSGMSKSMETLMGNDKVAAAKELQNVISDYDSFNKGVLAYNKYLTGKLLTEEDWSAIGNVLGISDMSQYQNGTLRLRDLNSDVQAQIAQRERTVTEEYNRMRQADIDRTTSDAFLKAMEARGYVYDQTTGNFTYHSDKVTGQYSMATYEDAIAQAQAAIATRNAVAGSGDTSKAIRGMLRAAMGASDYKAFYDALDETQQHLLGKMITDNTLQKYEITDKNGIPTGTYDVTGLREYLYGQVYNSDMYAYNASNERVAKYIDYLTKGNAEAFMAIEDENDADALKSAIANFVGDEFTEAFRRLSQGEALDKNAIDAMAKNYESALIAEALKYNPYLEDITNGYTAVTSQRSGARREWMNTQRTTLEQTQLANWALGEWLNGNRYDENVLSTLMSFTNLSEKTLRKMSDEDLTDLFDEIIQETRTVIEGVIEQQIKAITGNAWDLSGFSSFDDALENLNQLGVEVNGWLLELLQTVYGLREDDSGLTSLEDQYRSLMDKQLELPKMLKSIYDAATTGTDAEGRTLEDITKAGDFGQLLNTYGMLSYALTHEGFTDEQIAGYANEALLGGSSYKSDMELIQQLLPGLLNGELNQDELREVMAGDGKAYMEYLISKYSEIQEIINSLMDESIDTAEAVQKLNDVFDEKEILEKYGKNGDAINASLKKLSGTAKEARDEANRLGSSFQRLGYANGVLAGAIGKTGKELNEDELDVLSEFTGKSKEELKTYGADIMTEIIKGAQEVSDEEWDLNTDTMMEAAMREVNYAAAGGKGPEIQRQVQIAIEAAMADGNVDTTDVDNILAAADSKIRTAFAGYVGSGGSITAKIFSLLNGIGYRWEWNSTKGTTGPKTGGGGGGGKSATAKLIEKLKRDLAINEHEIKMIQYQEKKYESMNELLNENRMITLENDAQERYIEQMRKSIEELKKQMKTLKSDSDDWYSARDAILSYEEAIEEANQAIYDNTKKIQENRQAILKTRTDLEDTVRSEAETRENVRKEMLAGTVSMEEVILEAIRDRYQDEWDVIKRDIEVKRQALEEEKALIDERLQKRKQAEDEAAKYEQLAEYQRQLAYISMDSTRTKDAIELTKKIADLQKEIAWSVAENEAEAQKAAIDDQAKAYDEYVTIGDEHLSNYLEDANNFTDEVNKVLSMSFEDMMQWLQANVESYQLALDEQQRQMTEGWEDTFKQMYHITETYWTLIQATLGNKESWMEFMYNSDEYKNATDDMKAQLEYQWSELYDKYQSGQIDNAEYSHSDDFANAGSSTTPGTTKPGKTEPETQQTLSETLGSIGNTLNAAWQGIKNFGASLFSKNEETEKKGLLGGLLSGLKKNAEGGLVDYTGLAWVDGTMLRPESFLDATDTELLRKMLDAARFISFSPFMSSIDDSAFGRGNNTIGEVNITINEASISDDTDIEKLAEKVGESFVKELSINGFNVANYSF